MKSDFLLAITQLSAEKNLPKDVVLAAVETALVSAYKKDYFNTNQNIAVKINPNSGEVEVWAEMTVVDVTSDRRYEISLKEARGINKDIEIGDTLMEEATPHNAGRIAAQTAKQVILQRLHEAEHSAILEEFADKEGIVVNGLVQRIEHGQLFIDLGRTEAILPVAEQVRTERYRVGQRLKVLILQVVKTSKGPRVIVSRSHPDLLRRLLEVEVPEIFNGSVEIKAVSREAGYRSKLAVAARQQGIDPVGCCVGLRGIRIQNIVSELNGEKIDVVMWDPDITIFIANALSPAHIVNVELNKEEEVANVVVPDRQLSLAIGKEGQNARLAAKLSGWRIDIKSASSVEAEKLELAKLSTEAVETEEIIEEETVAEEIPEEILLGLEPALDSTETPADEEAEPLPDAEEAIVPAEAFFEPLMVADKTGKSKLRFAEDVLPPRQPKPVTKQKKKKKKGAYGKENAEDGIKLRRAHRDSEITDEDEEY
ncbi:transcription termination factor NusA [Chloroflexota bacterium]